ncbi:hypothetical protein GCM10007160_18570 [Litchfieldella qijiaojingensis]|uniref:HTH rpiR-type domain-containing protein n=1 Tax=Litchfieldella qijiaojingensis TaxID=980347 RepID=A0ABQ2YSZ2_9GAMM|nr:MurR/RpiR family transcriptional regulator [Halomonas qijiaojingensis]GGX91350.1 hypothetical protein GCM10007160_18570 [Halomonas qijiaojingensis]
MPNLKTLLSSPPVSLTQAERKVVRILLDDYPRAGLGPMARLAAVAGVSEPSVMRLVRKLGFSGYSDFQRGLVEEVDERLRSPRMQLDKQRYKHPLPENWDDYLAGTSSLVDETRQLMSAPDIQGLCKLLSSPQHHVWLHGGRYSFFLAGYLHAHLRLMRANCHLLPDSSHIADALIDVGEQDILVIFDYRRYQQQAQTLARVAAAQGARIILFTDIYASPLRDDADIVISAPVQSPSPFDTLVPAMAQVEALIACLTHQSLDTLDNRLARIDRIRSEFHVHLIEDA